MAKANAAEVWPEGNASEPENGSKSQTSSVSRGRFRPIEYLKACVTTVETNTEAPTRSPLFTMDGLWAMSPVRMIPPVTGNGMSIALESALLARTPLLRWSRGDFTWTETKRVVGLDLERAFSLRLRVARWLQRGLFVPALQEPLVRLAARRPMHSAIVDALAESPRWLRRPRVRLTLLLNPGTPEAVSMPLLAVCTRCELIDVVHGIDAPLSLRASAQELLDRSPPLPARGADLLQ